jgi:hypothetical protein
MNIGEQIRTIYIEPIEEPPPTEMPALPERVSDPQPNAGRELELVS